jgi:hypothetical protein
MTDDTSTPPTICDLYQIPGCAERLWAHRLKLIRSARQFDTGIEMFFILAKPIKRHGTADLDNLRQPPLQIGAIVDYCMTPFRQVPSGALMLLGGTGTGKTQAMAAVMRELTYYGCSGQIVTEADLLDSLRPDGDGKLGDFTAVDVLAIDDLGAAKPSEWSKAQITSIINARYEAKLATIITSNLPPQPLSRYVGERAWSRLVDGGTIVPFRGDDRRRPGNRVESRCPDLDARLDGIFSVWPHLDSIIAATAASEGLPASSAAEFTADHVDRLNDIGQAVHVGHLQRAGVVRAGFEAVSAAHGDLAGREFTAQLRTLCGPVIDGVVRTHGVRQESWDMLPPSVLDTIAANTPVFAAEWQERVEAERLAAIRKKQDALVATAGEVRDALVEWNAQSGSWVSFAGPAIADSMDIDCYEQLVAAIADSMDIDVEQLVAAIDATDTSDQFTHEPGWVADVEAQP